MKDEKKTVAINCRATATQNEIIKQNAKESGMSKSQFLVELGTNNGKADLSQIRKIIPHLAKIEDTIHELGLDTENIHKEVETIWQFLK